MDKDDDGVSTEMQPLTKPGQGDTTRSTEICLDDVVVPHVQHKWWHWVFFRDSYEASGFIFVIISAIPLIVLLSFTPQLAAKVKSATCLPNGDFALPGTSNIWDRKLFFAISVPVGGLDALDRWTFTKAKAIDVLWDIGVGRGLQLTLAWTARRIFSKALVCYMEKRPASYAAYVAVAFQAGGFRSLWSLLVRRSESAQPGLWSDRHSIRIFSLIVLATLYIASLPTLLSTMTGYITISGAFIEMSSGDARCNSGANNNCTLINCSPTEQLSSPGSLVPAWGYFHDHARRSAIYESPGLLTVDSKGNLVPDPLRDYYERYRDLYATAREQCWGGTSLDYATLDVSACTILNQQSTFNGVSLPKPMLNLEVYNPPGSGHGYDHWACGDYDEPFTSQQLREDAFNSSAMGICTSNGEYVWGFSYQLLFVTCIFQLLFAAMMFALWVEAHRHLWPARKAKDEAAVLRATTGRRVDEDAINRIPRDAVREAADHPDVYNSAFALVSQVRRHYGDDIFTWSDERRAEVIWRGSKGMQLREQETSTVRDV